MILEGLTEAIRCSLAYMSDHTDKTKAEMPLMQGMLVIDVSYNVFSTLAVRLLEKVTFFIGKKQMKI